MMIAELKRLADVAAPTDFHHLMKELEDSNRLFRVYTQVCSLLSQSSCHILADKATQNIDALEAKTGLSYGLGEWKEVRKAVSAPSPSKNSKGKGKMQEEESTDSAKNAGKKRKASEMEASHSDKENAPETYGLAQDPLEAGLQAARPIPSTSKLPDTPDSKGPMNMADTVPESSQDSTSPDGSDPPQAAPTDFQPSQPADDEVLNVNGPSSSQVPTEQPLPPGSKLSKTLTTPSVIPLHGTLDSMHCTKCHHVEPLDKHLSILDQGNSIFCPKCKAANASRNALGERSRGTGVMKVSVVLYGEEHAQAARVGEIAEKDLLKSARPDYLIVAGTTLKIPGVKKLVKELARVIKPEIEVEVKDENGNGTGKWIKQPVPSTQTKVIYVNNEAPTPETVWNSVFDTFVQGDLQVFANAVREELKLVPAIPKKLVSSTLAGYGFGSTKSRPSVPGRKVKGGSASARSNKQGLLSLKSSKGKITGNGKTETPTAPTVPSVPKQKSKPGWKGYALELVTDNIARKADYWETEVTGSRRRRGNAEPSSTTVIPTSASIVRDALAISIPDSGIFMAAGAPHSASIGLTSPIEEAIQVVMARSPEDVAKYLEGQEVVEAGPFCICDGPDIGTQMIECEAVTCERKWFHVDCVKPPKSALRNRRPTPWMCAECTTANLKADLPPSSSASLKTAFAAPRPLPVQQLLQQEQPASASTSNAPSPPSLASDVSTASDIEELASQRGDETDIVYDSQSTAVVSDSQPSSQSIKFTFSSGSNKIGKSPLVASSSSPPFGPTIEDSQGSNDADMSSDSLLTDVSELEGSLRNKRRKSSTPPTVAEICKNLGVPLKKARRSIRGRTSMDNTLI